MQSHLPQRIEVIDSHTAGEPTRCIISGGPQLGAGSVAERLARLRASHDVYRRAVLCEPRGSDVLVGALLVEPADPASAAGVIFFNNAGYLGMCGHGTVGVAATLAYLGRLSLGRHIFETPVGNVTVSLAESGEVTIGNVTAYRHRARVPVEVDGYGTLYGDVAWGGNWFYLIEEHPFQLLIEKVESLTDFTWKVRKSLTEQGITGANGAEIDHIELFGSPLDPANHSRNFVLCPGKAYDRSPCGTGTSAKLACLIADGKLKPGQPWRQEGILGSVFTGCMQQDGDRLIPTITGSAYVTAESSLIFEPNDPFRTGISTSEAIAG
ncbi:proline racemase family protein [Acidicapsa dinghuensis]|uniref:Proline racemase family protein n=1 Tax=Acidicapsa dinghuensis TaxID=2218256 RepID=A0ABW1EG84_9BACT|nr:proline racemase family protein [Acidicapsa dinghuensis]